MYNDEEFLADMAAMQRANEASGREMQLANEASDRERRAEMAKRFTASPLYDSTVSDAANTNARNKMLVAKMQAKEQESNLSNAYESGANEGFRAGYSDFEQRLAASQQYTPIVAGSPEDIAMQENINAGINYQPEPEISLLDAISGKLSGMFNGDGEPAQNIHAAEAAQAKEMLTNDAIQSAFVGDTSEEAMNRKYTQELQNRGL